MKKNNFKKNNILKEEPKEIKSLNWVDKNKFKEILAITDNSEFDYKDKVILSILKLKTWLIILVMIQLMKYLLKKV